MSRREYMEQLDMLLRDIPHMERKEALKYYEDYFEDAGKEHEAEVIEELGSPEELAKKLREDLKREESDNALPPERARFGEERENQQENTAKAPDRTGKSGNSSRILCICFVVVGIFIGIGHLFNLTRTVRQISGIFWHWGDASSTVSEEMVTENYPVYGKEGVQDLEIKAGLGDLVIESWEKDEISISYSKNYMKIERQKSELSLKTRKKWYFDWKYLFVDREDSKLDNAYQVRIKVPKEYVFREVTIDTGAGEADIACLAADSLSLKTGAGEVDVKEMTAAEKVYIEAGVGETVIHNLKATEAEFSIGVGELTVTGRVDGNVSAECGVGELAINLENEESDFNYEVSCGIGEISVNGQDYSGFGNSMARENGAAYDFDMTCGVGTIQVTLGRFREN